MKYKRKGKSKTSLVSFSFCVEPGAISLKNEASFPFETRIFDRKCFLIQFIFSKNNS